MSLTIKTYITWSNGKENYFAKKKKPSKKDPGDINESCCRSAEREIKNQRRHSIKQKKIPSTKENKLAQLQKDTSTLTLDQCFPSSVSETYTSSNLTNYLLTPELMLMLGYPVESKRFPGQVEILITGPFGSIVQEAKTITKKCASSERQCMRCKQVFYVSNDGECITQEDCIYHWGKLQNTSRRSEQLYSCCNARRGTDGCEFSKVHVWSGVKPGLNGPFEDYVRTCQSSNPSSDVDHGVYALDCEMCFTNSGLELTKISVVTMDGMLIYDTFVRPESPIIDYNTRFSGITADDMTPSKRVKTLIEVQNDLLRFITNETILVGHSLECDLRVLKMVHYKVIDTSVLFSHTLGVPYKLSLKSLARTFLNKDIQNGSHGSHEDAWASMQLLLWKLRNDHFII